MGKRIRWTFLGRTRRRPQTPQQPRRAGRASGEDAVLTHEEQDAEATPSNMTRLKTARL